jgi:glycosyltransferase involved in cell wall biosynthesis
MKKILFIAPQPFFEIRGTPIATKDMLTVLGEQYSVDLVTYSMGSTLDLKNVKHFRSFSFGFKKIKIGVSFKKILLDFGLFLKSSYLLMVNKYDYIHAVEEAAFFAVLFKKIKKIPLIYDMDSIMSEQVENGKFTKLSFIFEWIESKIIKNSDLILAISGNFKEYCTSINKDVNFVEIFDLPQIEKVALPEFLKNKFDTKKKKILYIGNGEKYQGVELLEETAKLIQDMLFYIIGTGKEGIKDNIIYISKIDMKHVWGVMQEVDLLVSPRLHGTNTPMKAYTYLASGKPIVATDIEAHHLFRKYFILVKENDPVLFKKAIEETFENHKDICDNLKTTDMNEMYSFDKFKKMVLENYKI